MSQRYEPACKCIKCRLPVDDCSCTGCTSCGGTGEVFTHADDCDDDLCALNGDMHSCNGQVVACDCTAIVKSPALPL